MQKNISKTKKTLFYRILLLCVIAALLFPAIKLLLIYFNIFSKSYSLEVDAYKDKIRKYAFKTGDGQNLFEAAFDEKNRKLLGEIDMNGRSPDDIFNEQITGLELENDFIELDKFYNNEFKLQEKKEIMEVKSTFEDTPNVIGGNKDSMIGDITDFKVLHNFDDSGIVDDSKKDFMDSREDNIARHMDKESDDKYTIYMNNRILSSKTPETKYKIFNQNKFYTSPLPDNSFVNATRILEQLELILSKEYYYRFEVVRFNLVSKHRINLKDLKIFILRDNYIIPNVGGKNDCFFKYSQNTIFSTFAMGYNPPAGKYTVLIKSESNEKWEGLKKKFFVIKRDVPSVQKGFSVVNMEWPICVKRFNIVNPDGVMGGYENIINWISYIDADALWMLAAQTTGWNPEINVDNPWSKGGFDNLKLLAPAAHEKNILIGAYIMSYYTPGNGKKVVGYDPSLGYDEKENKLMDSYHISLDCKKRYKDLLDISKKFQEDNDVDFIGFDFIRTGKVDGYELGPQIVNDMNIPVPDEYHHMPYTEKTKWFARAVKKSSNYGIIAKWRWWRAHKTSSIINSIILDGKVTKPVWVFTLGWDHGKQHGQDPYMFFDAGVFIDAVMLYEANEIQFKNMLVQWPNYMRDNNNNILIGNACDIRLLDGKSNFPPIEFFYRTVTGYRKIYREGFAKGIFFHDISRALWSSKRGIPINEWCIIYGSTISRYREETGVLPLIASVAFSADNETGTITVKNTSEHTVKNIQINYIPTQCWDSVEMQSPFLFDLEPQRSVQFKFRGAVKEEHRKDPALLGFFITAKNMRKNFFFTYRTREPFLTFALEYGDNTINPVNN
ncbi:hypothetical protein ACFL6D_00645 [Spirochaetota bacterium]